MAVDLASQTITPYRSKIRTQEGVTRGNPPQGRVDAHWSTEVCYWENDQILVVRESVLINTGKSFYFSNIIGISAQRVPED